MRGTSLNGVGLLSIYTILAAQSALSTGMGAEVTKPLSSQCFLHSLKHGKINWYTAETRTNDSGWKLRHLPLHQWLIGIYQDFNIWFRSSQTRWNHASLDVLPSMTQALTTSGCWSRSLHAISPPQSWDIKIHFFAPGKGNNATVGWLFLF